MNWPHPWTGGVPGATPLFPAPVEAPSPRRLGQPSGWSCPTCGIGVAPWMPYCPECKRREKGEQRATLNNVAGESEVEP